MSVVARAEERELSNAERIREAALEGFANEGVEATSIRDVAAAAGVSPGLVQHHYPSKAALREAVDQHILAEGVASFAEIPEPESFEELAGQLGDLVTEFVAGNELMGRYIARAIVEGEELALQIFDGFVALAGYHTERLREKGQIREDADLMWFGLHLILFNMAVLLFEPALDRRLPAPFRSPRMLERWNRATADLYFRGLDKGER
jgi:AcrR family transcriptional regulator